MLDRILGFALVLLAAAGAIYIAVHLIESVAIQLVVIASGVGAVLIVVIVLRAIWRANRW